MAERLADAAVSPIPPVAALLLVLSQQGCQADLCCSKDRSCLRATKGGISRGDIFARNTLRLEMQFVSLEGSSIIIPIISGEQVSLVLHD